MRHIRFAIGCLSAILAIAACHPAGPVNLVVNGGAEASHSDSVPPGWTNISGHWHAVEGDSAAHDYALAAEGRYLFFEGKDGEGVLQQDIPVDDYSRAIDDGRQKFIVTSKVYAFEQNPPDQSQLIVSTLTKGQTQGVVKYQTDTISSMGKWQTVTDTFLAPASTRVIRIQLKAIRRNGSDNDGYFDDVRLIPIVSDGMGWLIWVAAAVVLLCGAFLFRRFRMAVRRLLPVPSRG